VNTVALVLKSSHEENRSVGTDSKSTFTCLASSAHFWIDSAWTLCSSSHALAITQSSFSWFKIPLSHSSGPHQMASVIVDVQRSLSKDDMMSACAAPAARAYDHLSVADTSGPQAVRPGPWCGCQVTSITMAPSAGCREHPVS
jgi:hypothetical protein